MARRRPPRTPLQPDLFDGYSPADFKYPSTPLTEDQAVLDSLALMAANLAAHAVEHGEVRMDNVDGYRQQLLDGFRNELTGIGTWEGDKSFGGKQGGPDFELVLMSGAMAEQRWRGSDLGGRIVETIPREMIRRGCSLTVQPDEEETSNRAAMPNDDLWRVLKLLESQHQDSAAARIRRVMMDWPAVAPGAAAAPPPMPGELPPVSDEGNIIVEKMEGEMERLHAWNEIERALSYEVAYGGGAVFLGVDDGVEDLTQPLDLNKVHALNHLTAFRGGWDGELVAWTYYRDPRKAKYGMPEIYMLRNIGVPISAPPTPGSMQAPIAVGPSPMGPTGALIFFIHESRLLMFPGAASSHWARVQMRGWGDSVFTRVDEVLRQYDQTWAGIASLMQEFSIKVLKMKGLARLLASENPKDQGAIRKRIIAMKMGVSIANMQLIDSDEEFGRTEAQTLSGVADIMSEAAKRLAAAADIPVSKLMGQVQGGLGDASKGDISNFLDQVEGKQTLYLLPQLTWLHKVIFRSELGPTGGVEPSKWSVRMNPLRQLDEAEEAKRKNLIAQSDCLYIDNGVLIPEEVAATRFGGADFDDGPIVLDIEGRKRHAKVMAQQQPKPSDAPGAPALVGRSANGTAATNGVAAKPTAKAQ